MEHRFIGKSPIRSNTWWRWDDCRLASNCRRSALAEQLLVNPNTVARAYRELESAGVITSRQGSGAFVAANGSPLAARDKQKLLYERIDVLLAEASHLNVDVATLINMVRDRGRKIHSE